MELDIVRVEHAHAAQPVLERQGLGLELDAVVAVDVRPHVHLGRRLRVGVAELEDDLGSPDREAVLVGNAAAQDEGVVVEPEVLGVDEQHLADLRAAARRRSLAAKRRRSAWPAGAAPWRSRTGSAAT